MRANAALPSIVPRVILRLGLVIAIQIVVVGLLALAAPRTLASLGHYVVGTPSRALTAAVEHRGRDRAEMARLLATALVDEEGLRAASAASPVALLALRQGDATPTVWADWPSGWPEVVPSAVRQWLADRSGDSEPLWCTVYHSGRLFIVGAASWGAEGDWLVVVADETEDLGEVAARVAGARAFSVVAAAGWEPEGTVSLAEITSGLVHVVLPVPGSVGDPGLLSFDLPTGGIGAPLRAGAIILLASVLLVAGAQTLAFTSTYVQLMQPFREVLRALDAYATTGRWEPPRGEFQEQQMAVMAISRAVEARERAEKEARARLEELRAFVDALPAPAGVKDADLRYRLVNAALTRLIGCRPEELIGKTDDEILPEDLARVCTDHDRQTIESGQTLQFEEFAELEGQRHVFRIVKAPLRDSEGTVSGLVSVGVDITREREIQARLAEAQKAQMMGRLAGGVAHIFNNILTAIIGSSELALLELGAGHPARPDIEEVKAAANRGARVSRQLLFLGRGHPGGEGPTRVHEVLDDLLPVLKEMAGTQVELETAVAPELPPALVGAGELKQVLLNLVLNATEAMPDGGRLLIEGCVCQPPAEAVRIEPALSQGAVVVLRVADTGTGIGPGVREHVFEPFFTTKGAAGGRGLGLAVVQSIVRSYRGAVLFRSEEGRGTCFEVYLRSQAEPEVRTDRGAATGTGVPQGHEVILLAEDEPSVRQLTEKMLASQGYTLWTATRGDEALELVESRGQPPDLLLTDVVMPGMSGVELALALRDRYPGMRVLLMSGYASGHDGEDLQGFPLLWKPFTLDSLTQRVRSLLDS
ncbi:MAG: PAS domain-containing protein [Anaerolineae bacterium]|nr:PAS domain-containing protein [Anaerolineae bacterium]